MQIKQGSVVKSIAGHDSDRFYVVVRLEGDFAYIADGKVRKLESPKKKRLKHLAPTKSEVDLNETDVPFPHYEAYQYIDGKIILDENKLNEIIEAENNLPLSETEELKKRIDDLEKIVETLLQEK